MWSQMNYVRTQTKSKDGKLLAVGHSMGGILLYALLSRCGKLSYASYSLMISLKMLCIIRFWLNHVSSLGFKGMDSGLAAVTTLASTFDYSSSGTLLKYLLPMASTREPVTTLCHSLKREI